MAWKEPKSRPEQNARPSPESTTARMDGSAFTVSPASAMAANIAPSSAFILSGRFSRTWARPSATSIWTRSLMSALLSVGRVLVPSVASLAHAASAPSQRRVERAAWEPHMPCTPPPGGVEAEQRNTPSTGVA